MANERPKRRPGRPATGQTTIRSVRVGPLWEQAKTVAKERGETITDVIVRALTEYVRSDTN